MIYVRASAVGVRVYGSIDACCVNYIDFICQRCGLRTQRNLKSADNPDRNRTFENYNEVTDLNRKFRERCYEGRERVI